jgi:thiamine transporter
MFKDLQGFIESTPGKVTIVVLIVILLFLILRSGRNEDKKIDVRAMTTSAILAAIAMVLSFVRLFSLPFGGTVTLLSMLPIAVCAYLYGTRRGVMAGVVLGLVNLVANPYVIHPVQLLLDYPLAFGALGIGGSLRNRKNGLTKTYLAGIIGRYICAVLSGVIFFGSYAPESFNALTWALFYNFTYIAAEGAITIIILNLPPVKRAMEMLKEKAA